MTGFTGNAAELDSLYMAEHQSNCSIMLSVMGVLSLVGEAVKCPVVRCDSLRRKDGKNAQSVTTTANYSGCSPWLGKLYCGEGA